MTHIFVFNFVLVGVCVYAFVAGGAPERVAAAIFLGGAAASYVVLGSRELHFEPKLVLIDLIVLATLVALATRANRFWPLYASALQLITLAVHGVKVYNPALATWMWMATSSKLAYPILILLVIGVARHRERTARFGIDRAWSGGRLFPVQATSIRGLT